MFSPERCCSDPARRRAASGRVRCVVGWVVALAIAGCAAPSSVAPAPRYSARSYVEERQRPDERLAQGARLELELGSGRVIARPSADWGAGTDERRVREPSAALRGPCASRADGMVHSR